MNTKLVGYLSVLALVIAIVACFLPIGGSTIIEKTLGAAAGPDFYSRVYFKSGSVNGGDVYATTSTAATYTLTEAEVNQWNKGTVISWTPNIITTLSLGATSTRSLIPNVGDVVELYLRNASSTAAGTITLAAVDTSVDLQMAEATGGDLVLSGLNWAKLTLIRNSNTLGAASQVTAIFDEMTPAD